MATEANIPEDVSATNTGVEGRYSTTAQLDSNPNECLPADSIKPSRGLSQYSQCSESSAEAENKEREDNVMTRSPEDKSSMELYSHDKSSTENICKSEHCQADKMENQAQKQISENEKQHQIGVLSKDVETGGDKVQAINDINIEETDHDKENDGTKISRPASAEELNPKVHEEESSQDNSSLDQHLELITEQHASLKVIPESIVNEENTRSKGEEDAALECNKQAISISETNFGLVHEALLPILDLKTKSQGEENETVMESYTKDEDTETTIHVKDEMKEIYLAGVQSKKAEMPSVLASEWKDPESIGSSIKLEHDNYREEDASTVYVAKSPYIHSVEETTFEAASKNGNDNSEKQRGGKKDSWQKNEPEDELREQIILIPEKTEIAASRENAEKRIEQNIHLVENFEEKEEKDVGETSIATEKSFPLTESITEIQSEERIFPLKIENELNSEGPLVEETGQPDNGETGKVSKTEAEEKHQESSKFCTENNEQDEHCSETQSTENLIIKHTDSEAMVTRETITKSTKDTEELEKLSESHSEEKIDIEGDEKIIPGEPKETEEATDKQSHETAKESAPEDEAPSRLPITASISDETIEQSMEEESLKDESTLVEKNDTHKPENDVKEKKKAAEAFDLPKSTGGQDTHKQQIIEGSVDKTLNNFQDNEKEIQSSRDDTGGEFMEENYVTDLPPEFIQITGLEERHSTAVQLDSNPRECSPTESESSVESSSTDKSPTENISRSEHSLADKKEHEELTETSENERQNKKRLQIKNVETGGDKVEAINDENIEEPDHDIENDGEKISMLTSAEEPNLKFHEEETSKEISSIDQHLELITDQHASFKVIPESIVIDENTRSKGEVDADLEYNEQATSTSKTNLGPVNEALPPNLDLKTKSQGEEDEREIEYGTRDKDRHTTIHVEDEFKEICLAGEQNRKAEMPSVLEGEWKDPESIGSSDNLEHENKREEDASTANGAQSPYLEKAEESTFEATSRNGNNDDDKSENQSSNLVTEGASTKVAIVAGETLQKASYAADKDKNRDIYESEWQEIDVPPVDRMAKAENLACLNRDVRGAHEEVLIETNEDGKINPERHDEEERDSWQKIEQEVELGEQVILIPEKTEIQAPIGIAKNGVEQNIQLIEKFEETEENDEPTSTHDSSETSMSTEKSLPQAESITEIKSEERISPSNIANDLNSEGPLIEETGQPDGGETGEVSKTEAEDKHQESSKFCIEIKEQDEHCFETPSTENLVIKHTDSEAMITETITKSTKDAEEHENVPELHSEEKIDIKGDEKIILEEPKEIEEATNKQSHETAKESASEDEVPSRFPITALISDETIEQSIEEESLEHRKSTLVEKNDSHRPENVAEEKKKAAEAFDLPKATGEQDTSKQQITEGSVDEKKNKLQDNEKEIQSSRDDTGREIEGEYDVTDVPPEFIQNTGLEERYPTAVQLESNPKESSPAESKSSVESSSADKSPTENISRSEHSLADKIENEELTEIYENERLNQKGLQIKDVETEGDKFEAINNKNIEEPDHGIENDGAKISMLTSAEEPNLKVHEGETLTEISSLDQHLELTDQHVSFKVIPESIVKDENTRSNGEVEADLEYNEHATSISKTNLGLVNEALLPNLDLKTKSQGEEDERDIEYNTKDEDTDTTTHVEDEFEEICLAGEQNKRAEMPSVLEGEWKDPESIGSSDNLEHENKREEDASTANGAQSPYLEKVEESTFEAASRNGNNDDDQSENQSSNLVTEGASTKVAIVAGETLQEVSYAADKDKNKDIYESEWQEIDVPPVNRMAKAEDLACLKRDERGAHEEGLMETNEDGKINPERHDGEKRDSLQKNEQEAELGEQVILIPENTEIEDRRENAENGVKQKIQLIEKFEQTEEKDEATSTNDTGETSVSTEKSLPLAESITEIQSEERILLQKIENDSNSDGPLVGETGQPDSGETGEVSKTEAEEKHRESSKICTENNDQDEHCPETPSTENLVIKHTDSEAMATTETITKSTKDTEELEKLSESHSEEKIDIEGDEKIIPGEPNETEEATDKQSHETPKESTSENEASARLPTAALIRDETIEQSIEEESLKDSESTLVEKNDSHSPENNAEEKKKAVEAFDLPKATGGQDICEQQTRKGSVEDSVCLDRDVRAANEDDIIQTGLTETYENDKINPEKHDGEERESWQKNEEDERGKQIILIPEKTKIAAPRDNAEKIVEQDVHSAENFDETEEQDEPTSTADTRETSISTERSLPLVEPVRKTKSEELNYKYLLVKEAGQLESGETGEVSKTNAEEKHQEGKFSTEKSKQDEHLSETQSTENLAIKHMDSEAMVKTETITKSTKDTEELQKVTESHSEEKIDVKGNEKIIPEGPKEMEEATDKQSHKTAKERASEDEVPSRIPTAASIRDETVEQSLQEESLKIGESTFIEEESHRPENDAEENLKPIKASDLPKTTGGQDTCKQQIIEGSVEEKMNNFQENEKEIQSSREDTSREIKGKGYVPDLPPEFTKNAELGERYLMTAQLDSSPNECSSAESKSLVEPSSPDKSPRENIHTSEHFQADKIEDQALTNLSGNESRHQKGVPCKDVETGSDKDEAIIDKNIEQDHDHNIENDGAKIPELACAEKPNPKVHEEETSIDNISLDQHLELITDQHASSKVIAESIEKEMINPHINENTRSKGEEDADLECNEQAKSISKTNLGLVNEALRPNLDLKTKSQGDEDEKVIDSCSKDEDTDTTIYVEDEFNKISLAGVENKKAEMPSVPEGEWKDPESITSSDELEHEDNKEEDASTANVKQSPYIHKVAESTTEAASKNGDKDDDDSGIPSSNLVTDGTSTQVATEAAETLQEPSYTACQDKNKDIHESVWEEVDVPPVDRMAKAEDSACLKDVRGASQEDIIQTGLKESNEDSKIDPEKCDGEKRDSWQTCEEEDELEEQETLIHEKTEIASQTEDSEKKVEQNIHPAENFDEKQEKDKQISTLETAETSISTEKSFPPVESITNIKSEEKIFPQIIVNDLNSKYPLVERTGQPDSGEIDEVSKTEAKEKHQESSKFSTENNKQDEHCSETENLVIKHMDSDVMVTTETIAKSTKDTEELEKGDSVSVTQDQSEETLLHSSNNIQDQDSQSVQQVIKLRFQGDTEPNMKPRCKNEEPSNLFVDQDEDTNGTKFNQEVHQRLGTADNNENIKEYPTEGRIKSPEEETGNEVEVSTSEFKKHIESTNLTDDKKSVTLEDHTGQNMDITDFSGLKFTHEPKTCTEVSSFTSKLYEKETEVGFTKKDDPTTDDPKNVPVIPEIEEIGLKNAGPRHVEYDNGSDIAIESKGETAIATDKTTSDHIDITEREEENSKPERGILEELNEGYLKMDSSIEETDKTTIVQDERELATSSIPICQDYPKLLEEEKDATGNAAIYPEDGRFIREEITDETAETYIVHSSENTTLQKEHEVVKLKGVSELESVELTNEYSNEDSPKLENEGLHVVYDQKTNSGISDTTTSIVHQDDSCKLHTGKEEKLFIEASKFTESSTYKDSEAMQGRENLATTSEGSLTSIAKEKAAAAASETKDFRHENEPNDEFPSEKTVEAADPSEKVELASESMAKDQSDEKIYQAEEKSNSEDHIFESIESIPGPKCQGESHREVNVQFMVEHHTSVPINAHEASLTDGCTENILQATEKANGSENILEHTQQPKSNLNEPDALSAGYETVKEATAANSEEREYRILGNLEKANDNFSSLTAIEASEEGIHIEESEKTLFRKSCMGSQGVEKDSKAEIFNKDVTNIFETLPCMSETTDVTTTDKVKTSLDAIDTDNIQEECSNSEDSRGKQSPEIVGEGGQEMDQGTRDKDPKSKDGHEKEEDIRLTLIPKNNHQKRSVMQTEDDPIKNKSSNSKHNLASDDQTYKNAETAFVGDEAEKKLPQSNYDVIKPKAPPVLEIVATEKENAKKEIQKQEDEDLRDLNSQETISDTKDVKISRTEKGSAVTGQNRAGKLEERKDQKPCIEASKYTPDATSTNDEQEAANFRSSSKIIVTEKIETESDSRGQSNIHESTKTEESEFPAEVHDGVGRDRGSENIDEQIINYEVSSMELQTLSGRDETVNRVKDQNPIFTKDLKPTDSGKHTAIVDLGVEDDPTRKEASSSTEAVKDNMQDKGAWRPIDDPKAGPQVLEGTLEKKMEAKVGNCVNMTETTPVEVQKVESTTREAQLDDKPMEGFNSNKLETIKIRPCLQVEDVIGMEVEKNSPNSFAQLPQQINEKAGRKIPFPESLEVEFKDEDIDVSEQTPAVIDQNEEETQGSSEMMPRHGVEAISNDKTIDDQFHLTVNAEEKLQTSGTQVYEDSQKGSSNKVHEKGGAPEVVIQLEPHEQEGKECIDSLIESKQIKEATASKEAPANLKTIEKDFKFVPEVHSYEVLMESEDKEKHIKTALTELQPEENQYEITTAAGKTINTQVSDDKIKEEQEAAKDFQQISVAQRDRKSDQETEQSAIEYPTKKTNETLQTSSNDNQHEVKSEAIEKVEYEDIKDNLPDDTEGKNVTEAAQSVTHENRGTETKITGGRTKVVAPGEKEPGVTVDSPQEGHVDIAEVGEYTREIQKLEESSRETVDINLTVKADVETRKTNDENVQHRPEKAEEPLRVAAHLDQATAKTQQVETPQFEEAKTDSEKDDGEDENRKLEPLSGASAMVETSKDRDVKVAHKKSHNILSGVGSKVKRSISKVKKAITGKSSHPKTPSTK